MATRTDSSPEQWQALRNAPQLVALATATAGDSGLFGRLSEGMSALRRNPQRGCRSLCHDTGEREIRASRRARLRWLLLPQPSQAPATSVAVARLTAPRLQPSSGTPPRHAG